MHKAAGGSSRHQAKAAAAVEAAAQRLDTHHGSASGLMSPWQGWHGKGGNWAQNTSPSYSVKQFEEFLNWSAKGNGKGKGKDATQPGPKGKGKGKGKMVKCPGNLCKDYHWGKNHWYPADAQKCDCCGHHNPNLGSKELIALKEATAKCEKELAAKVKKEEEEKKKKGKAPEPTDADKMAVEEEDEEEDDLEGNGCLLTDEYKSLMGMLKLPHPLSDEDDWQAEKAVKLGIAANPDLGTEPMRKAVEQCKSLLALEHAGDALGQATKIDFAAAKKRLVTLEKDLAKAERSTPGAKLTACELRSAKQRFEDATAKTKKFADVGELKAAEKQTRMEEICREHIAAWQKQLASIQECAVVRVRAWNERKAELHRRTTAVLGVYDTHIVEADGKVTGGGASTPKPVEPAADADTKAAVAMFVKLKAIAKVPLQRSDLPELVMPPPKEIVPVLAKMHYWGQASVFAEALLPYTMAEIGTTPKVAFALVGAKVWSAYFGDTKGGWLGVGEQEVCPMQLRALLIQQVTRYAALVRGTEQCFITEHAEQEGQAQQELDAAGPRLAKLRASLGNGANY